MSKIFIGGGILLSFYHWIHPNVPEERIPYWYKRSLVGELWHLIRKGICQNIAPNCVLTPVRIALYRLCGFKIGKGCFIGMKCYLDDLCVDKIVIGNYVTISYGVYFACHGRKQDHNKIVIKDGAYIGMRTSITARHNIEIGESAVIGAMALVNKSIPAGTTAVGIPCRVIDNKQCGFIKNGRTRQTLWGSCTDANLKTCCQTIHNCQKVVPLHYESE